jgi:hypothetical protein
MTATTEQPPVVVDDPLRPYVVTLLSTLAFFIVQAGFPETAWSRAAGAVLQGITLLLALHLARARHRLVVIARVVVGFAIIWSIIGILVTDASDIGASSVLLGTAVMVALAPPALFIALFRQPAITLRSVLCAVTIYLLIGLFFAVVFRAIALQDPEAFTGAVGDLRPAVFHYFSFTTLTTVGYGDIQAATDVPRLLAVMEALIGQLYLVTIVAVVVGNLGRTRSNRSLPSAPRAAED